MASESASSPRRSLDWRRAARLWVKGIAPATIAAELGIDEEHFWAHRERSPRFRRFVQIARAQAIQECRDQMVNLVGNKQKQAVS